MEQNYVIIIIIIIIIIIEKMDASLMASISET